MAPDNSKFVGTCDALPKPDDPYGCLAVAGIGEACFLDQLEDAGDQQAVDRMLAVAGPPMQRVEDHYGVPTELGPYDDFEWGMLNGKLSALRWVLGSDWDFLDT
jgi:hypothetical protein